ncbi:MAG: RidA family protein [Actinomycetota bacterium]|nr:RidA family protein [Actinomycetota bacterium]
MYRRSINPSDLFESTRYGFSQAVATSGGSTVYVSGQVGWNADGQLADGGLAGQTARAFDNLATVLEDAGGSLLDAVSLRIYVVEDAADDLAPITQALLSRFPKDRQPATTWLAVSGLAGEGLVIEIEAVAVIASD